MQFGDFMFTDCILVHVSEQHRIPETVAEQARELRESKDFTSIGEAIRHMCQVGGYDV